MSKLNLRSESALRDYVSAKKISYKKLPTKLQKHFLQSLKYFFLSNETSLQG